MHLAQKEALTKICSQLSFQQDVNFLLEFQIVGVSSIFAF